MGILEDINSKLDEVLGLLKTKSPSPSTAEPAADEPPAKRTRTPSKPKAPAATILEVKTKLKEILDKKGRKVAVALLQEHKAEKIGDLEPSQFDEFLAACDQALSADEEDDLDL